MFVTADQKRQLREMGVSDDEIYNMSPTDAHERLGVRQPHSVKDTVANGHDHGETIDETLNDHTRLDLKLKLLSNGYQPIATNGKKPVATGWQLGEITADRIKHEHRDFAYARNIGLRSGELVPVDIDLVNLDHILQIIDIVLEVLPYTPMLRRGAKGIAMCYRNKTPIGKLKIFEKKDKADKTKLCYGVEILGTKNQIVAYGVHPDTKERYSWPEKGFEPALVPFDQLPEVTPEQLRDLADRVFDKLKALGYRMEDVTEDVL
jgi:hypothetical protein